jgi:thymidylate kinase
MTAGTQHNPIGDQAAAPVHPRLDAVFRALDQAEVAWALLRGADDLTQPSGDVDLLVDTAALPRLDRILTSTGLLRMGMRGHGSHRFYFAYLGDEDLWIKLDVVSRIDFGHFQHLRAPVAAACLDRRHRVDSVWRLAPEDEATLFLLHLLLDKGRVAPERREAARAAARLATASSPVAAFAERLAPGTWHEITRAVLDDAVGRAEELARALAHTWAARRRVRSRLSWLANRTLRRLELPVTGLEPGRVVALVGPDGAGKTTLSEALRDRLPVPTRTVYMGLWQQSRWDGRLSAVPGGRLLQRTVRIVRSNLSVRRHQLRGRLVLLDRFAQDALLPGGVDTSRGGRLNQWLSLRLSPRTDLHLLLDATGEVMFARKGEHTPERLEERRQAYLRLVPQLGPTAVLDAARPADEVAGSALAAVWDALGSPGRRGPGGAPARTRGSAR